MIAAASPVFDEIEPTSPWPYYPDLLAKPVPRYTSYPTADNFSSDVGYEDYASELSQVSAGTPISLYVHIPFCEKICWYCGCNTNAVNRQSRLADYLLALETELALVAKILGGRAHTRNIAFGGGSPNAIAPVEFVRLLDRITTLFDAREPTISVELDPRSFSSEWALVLAASNVSRVSMGVQTFAPHVQKAIGRIQPLEDIEKAMSCLRMRGIQEINFDLMYGLPQQSLEDLEETIETAIELRPSRIALFGYAHLPKMIARQRQIASDRLPDSRLRFEQSLSGYQRLTAAGYQPIGFDHFALPEDSLAIAAKEGRVFRNFQGFTEDNSDIVHGFGASAISSMPGLSAQNEKHIGRYRQLLGQGILPTQRGIFRSQADRKTGQQISAILCTGKCSLDQGNGPKINQKLREFENIGLLHMAGSNLVVSETARPYLRHIAASFDEYLAS